MKTFITTVLTALTLWCLPAHAGDSTQAIARWDVVDNQVFTGAFEIGVIAFHIDGITSVEFYADSALVATETDMSWNPRTGVWEYWTTIDASDCIDGPVELYFIAQGATGLSRSLGITLYANSGGTLLTGTKPVAYVSSTGDDGNDGSSGAPYVTLTKGVREVDDGGTVVLMDAGTYELRDGRQTGNHWVTITKAAELAREEVIIANPGSVATDVRFKTNYLRLKGISVDLANVRSFYGERDQQVWLDSVYLFNSEGRYDYTPVRPFRRNEGQQLYATGTDIVDCFYGTNGMQLARNISMRQMGSGDLLTGADLAVNIIIDSVVGGYEGAHTDLSQYFGSADNVIIYGVKMTRATAVQNILIDQTGTTYKNLAFVNILCENLPFTGTVASQFHNDISHLLLWHVGLFGQSMTLRNDRSAFTIADVSIKNCTFLRSQWERTTPLFSLQFTNNHMVNAAGSGKDIDGTGLVYGAVVFTDGVDGGFTVSGAGAAGMEEAAAVLPGFAHPNAVQDGNTAADIGAFPFAMPEGSAGVHNDQHPTFNVQHSTFKYTNPVSIRQARLLPGSVLELDGAVPVRLSGGVYLWDNGTQLRKILIK